MVNVCLDDLKLISNEILRKKNNMTSTMESELLESYCLEFLDSINEKLEIYIGMFNQLIEQISLLIKKRFPEDPSLIIYHGIVEKYLQTKKLEPISIFVKYVYANDEYRKNIDEGDDKFFMKNNYKEITNNGEENKVQELLIFKTYWNRLKDKDKNFIKDVMKTMLQICAKYIVEKDDGNQITEIMMIHIKKEKIN